MASSSSSNGPSICTICLDPVLNDNSRGKAQLICGHVFHLDCIGTEFNCKRKMKCPNCRVKEDGQWGLPPLPLPKYEEFDMNTTPPDENDMNEDYATDDAHIFYSYRELYEAVRRSLENQPIQYHHSPPPPESYHHYTPIYASFTDNYDARVARVTEPVILQEPETPYDAPALGVPPGEASESSSMNTELSLALIPSTSSADDHTNDAVKRGPR
ncbi:hypothetical protein CASFOL_005082 [Castilleja foliolosa]|uniref:RING-type domain-containing protein n=1 Tax=Castilleja foliolosa TaxID=1961234 RepID=A0ABD3E6H1_9LAMI